MRARLLAIEPVTLLVLPGLVALFTATQAVAARWLRIPTGPISVGVGPEVARWRRLRFHALPLGASLKVGPPDDDGTTYQQLSVGQKLGLQLSGPAALALLAPVLRLLHPDLGLVCLLLAAVNLVPLPGTSGGQSLTALVELSLGHALPAWVVGVWSLLGLVGMAAAVGWLAWG